MLVIFTLFLIIISSLLHTICIKMMNYLLTIKKFIFVFECSFVFQHFQMLLNYIINDNITSSNSYCNTVWFFLKLCLRC